MPTQGIRHYGGMIYYLNGHGKYEVIYQEALRDVSNGLKVLLIRDSPIVNNYKKYTTDPRFKENNNPTIKDIVKL